MFDELGELADSMLADPSGILRELERLPELLRTDLSAAVGKAKNLQFVAACWTGQIYRHFPELRPSYVAEWNDLAAWQRETDSDIFERIEGDRTAR